MFIFDLLKLMNPAITPEQSKIHLATSNGTDNPLDVYRAGGFNEWQRWQSKKNFERKFVISFIALPEASRWLFAGVYVSKTSSWFEEDKHWYYELVEDPLCTEMSGRMVASFNRPGRQAYLNADSCATKLLLSEVFAERLSIGDFPGFKEVNLTKANLDVIINQSVSSWRSALSSVAGVYLISDTLTGKLYIGKATGEGGIWQRWQCYASDGHGGNIELRKLLNEDPGRAKHFIYSVLEIADTHASEADVLARESHWKSILLSRNHGLNAN